MQRLLDIREAPSRTGQTMSDFKAMNRFPVRMLEAWNAVDQAAGGFRRDGNRTCPPAPSVFLVGLLAALWLAACSSETDPPQGECELDGLFLTIRDGDGLRPERMQIILDLDGAEIESVLCESGQGSAGRLACGESGAVLRAHPLTVGVVVKAPGHHTLTHQTPLHYEELSGAGPGCHGIIRHGELELTLERLDPFAWTEDYCTGFGAETGLEQFLDFSVITPTEMGEAAALKFYIEDLDGQPAVYFQNTRRHFLHYGFVRNVLGRPYSLEQYESQTYHGEDRIAMAGTLVLYPDLVAHSGACQDEVLSPLTIEYFPRDDLSPRQAVLAYRLLEERMLFVPLAGPEHRLFYVPATTIHDQALRQDLRRFQAAGALWLYREELYGGMTLQLLNPGTAYGTLRLMTPEQLAVSPVSFQDVLVLTRLPNDLPLVGGTITEELQTPLAHVNVAARARGTPNMALIGASTDQRVAPYLGRLVRFQVTPLTFTLEETTLDQAQLYWDSLIPDEPTVPPANVEQPGLWDLEDLSFADSLFVGAKAANLAELFQLLGELVPDGFAVPFHYYDRFLDTPLFPASLCPDAMDDCLDEGRSLAACQSACELCQRSAGQGQTLRQTVDRLLDDEGFNSDSALREACLDGLRYLFHHIPVDADFARLLDERVQSQFGNQTVRLRSSTNAEDLENFSGAGLYRSVSSSLDSDDPPSSRIRRVWASVWNWQAFEERSFWNIDHRAVRMGVAVHRAFPDEVANGVIITRNLADPVVPDGFYVNVQLGEVSVTNPANGALPEVFSIIPGAGSVQIVRQRYSSLSPDEPIMTNPEIAQLYQAVSQVQNRFAVLYRTNPFDLVLDLEFKLDGPARQLIIKQVRPYFER
ncbi:MAG: hypothetical protein JW797_03000 [Bradymonadales bacterium]|nr:hypothetical protein [Bradymonadales bacterium]